MQSDGGLVDVSKFSGLRAILSGPAGGVVGYALTSFDEETKVPVIGFDMGGTSTGNLTKRESRIIDDAFLSLLKGGDGVNGRCFAVCGTV